MIIIVGVYTGSGDRNSLFSLMSLRFLISMIVGVLLLTTAQIMYFEITDQSTWLIPILWVVSYLQGMKVRRDTEEAAYQAWLAEEGEDFFIKVFAPRATQHPNIFICAGVFHTSHNNTQQSEALLGIIYINPCFESTLVFPCRCLRFHLLHKIKNN